MGDNKDPEHDPLLGDLTGPDFSGMSDNEIVNYWRNTTVEQRFHEIERLRRLECGLRALERLDKTKIQIISSPRA